MQIGGVRTNLPLLRWIAQDEAFARGETTTRFLPDRLDESRFSRTAFPAEVQLLAVAAMLRDDALPWRIAGLSIPLMLARDEARATIRIDRAGAGAVLYGDLEGTLQILGTGAQLHVALGEREARGVVHRHDGLYAILWNGIEYAVSLAPPPQSVSSAASAQGRIGAICAPMPGKILRIAVSSGERVEARTLLMVLEAMKMEHRIEAAGPGTVTVIHTREGATVSGGAALLELEA
ncbi:MAG TPA: biotin/lipoyl-containing protein, partial [Candidatus Dormibacteraeota bacterium]|nr:biotin/lipoyl-containing protein [Candidatus Dormibacteraeota bacterium]